MLVTVMDMKKEANKRINLLGINLDAIKDFEQHGTLHCSHRAHFGSSVFGTLFKLNAEEKEIIGNIEQKYTILIYHMTHELTDAGEIYDLFYVSCDKEAWPEEDEAIQKGKTVAYIMNSTNPDFSKFDNISFKKLKDSIIKL